MKYLNTTPIHPSWQPLIDEAIQRLDPAYLLHLQQKPWLPGAAHVFNAFSLPLSQTRYILFGESPYPRAQSANGYAFWDAAVAQLWSPTGLAKPVNRATSLRHLIKMLLLADAQLSSLDTSQAAIARIDKKHYVDSIGELFGNFLRKGFLLLNASLALSDAGVRKDAQAWRPFIAELLRLLALEHTDIQLILFGNVAKMIDQIPSAQQFQHFYAEHPYNISFVTNPKVIDFFRPFHLLEQR